MNADPSLMLLLIGGMILVLIAAAVALLTGGSSAGRVERRALAVTTGQADPAPTTSSLGALREALRWLGRKIQSGSGAYSPQDLMTLESAIASAGLNPSRVLPLVLGAKLLFTLLVPLAAIGYGLAVDMEIANLILLVCLALPLGMLGPEWALRIVRRPYVAALRRGLPDALDLLVVCTEAGMGLEQALEHVAKEIASSNPAISVALTKLLDELKVLPDRRVAFANFGQRSGVDGIRRLATMLGQTLQYGTPIAEALRFVASDLRRERMTALEAKCARLPALLVLPLILFIMPSLFIVLAASPLLRVLDMLMKMSQAGG